MKSKYYPLFTSFFVGNVMYGIKAPSATFLPEIPRQVQLPVSPTDTKPSGQVQLISPLDVQLLGQVLSPQFIKNLLKNEGTLTTYAKITAIVEKKLLEIKDNIDWINDLMERIHEIFKNKLEMQANLNSLDERQKNLNNAYRACIKELKYEPQGNCSLLVNVIKDLKELQDVTQEFRNSARNLLNHIRLLLPLNQDTPEIQGLRGSKLETKLIDQHGSEITATTDQIISYVLVPALGVFNEYAREERGQGITGSQSNRAL